MVDDHPTDHAASDDTTGGAARGDAAREPDRSGSDRRPALAALGVAGLVAGVALVGAVLQDDEPPRPSADEAPSDDQPDEPTDDPLEDAGDGGSRAGGSTDGAGGDDDGDGPAPGADDEPAVADLPSFVDQSALTSCATAGAQDLVDFPESTDDLVPSTTAQVSELRDLDVERPVEATFLTDDELRARVTEAVEQEYAAEEADLDRRLLSALGVVDVDVDLRELFTELQSEQVAGFYDPETGELVVEQTGEADAVSGLDKVTLAHEITHALADQRFDLDLDELPGGADAEQARLAVIEGDATLAMTLWSTRGLSVAEQLALATNASAADAAEQLADIPRYLVGGLVFPYEAGLNLVCAAYLDGGWDAVDALYANPPATTAQVLDLDLWREDVQPVEVALPQPPAEGWTAARDDTLGRLDLQLLFEAPDDDTSRALADAADLAAGWRGGRTVVWRPADAEDPSDVVDVVVDGEGLCEPMSAWLDATWASSAFTEDLDEVAETEVEGRTIRRSCDGSTVTVRISSPTAGT